MLRRCWDGHRSQPGKAHCSVDTLCYDDVALIRCSRAQIGSVSAAPRHCRLGVLFAGLFAGFQSAPGEVRRAKTRVSPLK